MLRSATDQKIFTPQTSEQAAEILRDANGQASATEIAGSGTKRGWGNPVEAAVLLDMHSMSGVREHSWQDMTATVAAGTPWAAMQQTLAHHGQFVALDPLWPERATVAGIIACNDSGSLRHRYGSLRDLIIGMTIVLADGTIAKSGGKVVKNVAGYDIHKLMIGAFGTLGLITEVTFRLHPLPKSSTTWTITSNDVQALESVRHQLADSTMAIDALQIRTDREGFALDVKFAASQEALEDHSRRLRGIFTEHQIASGNELIWLAREDVFQAGRATVKITLPSTCIVELTSVIHSLGGHCVTQQTGIMTANLDPDSEKFSNLRSRVEALGGSLSILQWPEDAVSPERWNSSGTSVPLMREIKRRFDPNRILNPGRFLGGI